MVFQYWHLVVVAALGALVVWGFRVSRRLTLLGLAATLVAISGFLLYTLVLEEAHLEADLNSQLETLALIGIPAIMGVSLGVLVVRSARSRQA
jgi:uncharacterized membrane protein YedE/YeeE